MKRLALVAALVVFAALTLSLSDGSAQEPPKPTFYAGFSISLTIPVAQEAAFETAWNRFVASIGQRGLAVSASQFRPFSKDLRAQSGLGKAMLAKGKTMCSLATLNLKEPIAPEDLAGPLADLAAVLQQFPGENNMVTLNLKTTMHDELKSAPGMNPGPR